MCSLLTLESLFIFGNFFFKFIKLFYDLCFTNMFCVAEIGKTTLYLIYGIHNVIYNIGSVSLMKKRRKVHCKRFGCVYSQKLPRLFLPQSAQNLLLKILKKTYQISIQWQLKGHTHLSLKFSYILDPVASFTKVSSFILLCFIFLTVVNVDRISNLLLNGMTLQKVHSRLYLPIRLVSATMQKKSNINKNR